MRAAAGGGGGGGGGGSTFATGGGGGGATFLEQAETDKASTTVNTVALSVLRFIRILESASLGVNRKTLTSVIMS